MMKIPSVLKLLIAVLLFSILPVLGYALTPDQVFDKVKDSIVVVKTLDAQGKVKGFGSGVLLPSGKIATNCHVVEGGASFQVGRGKEVVRATLYAEDGDKDICLLDAKGVTGQPAQLGKAAGLKVGVPVYAVGAPQGLELSLSDGIVAQLRGGSPPFIQTTAAISPGSSGGGLFDAEGRLVGLITLYIEGGQNLNFAMPVEWIDDVRPGIKPIADSQSRTEWLKRAIALERMKDWQALLDLCQRWAKSEPKNAAVWYAIGFSYANLKRHDEAIEAYRQSLRINPEYASAWNDLGNAYINRWRYYDAIEAYRQALRNDPEYLEAWSNLGDTYINTLRYNDAIEAYRQTIRINPKDAKAWNNLGNTYSELKRHDEAIEALRQALRINPEYTSAWNSLGETYTNLKRYNEAINAHRQAIRIDPKDAEAWNNLGGTYIKLKQYYYAAEAYRQTIRINPKDAKAWSNLGAAYIRLKNYNDAIEALRQAISINPEDVGTLYGLTFAYYFSGNRTDALNAVQKLRRLDSAKADELFNIIVPR